MKPKTSYVILLAALSLQFGHTTAQTISTVVGTGTPGFGGDGGPATAALLNAPGGLAFDAGGNMYISDLWNYRIRKVTTAATISTIAGNGTTAIAEGVPATASGMAPFLLAVDAAGNLYHADASNGYVRVINTSGIITTVAGNGSCTGPWGGGVATATPLCQNDGVAIDNSGNVIFSNSSFDTVYRISPAGMLQRIAGGGSGPGVGDGGPATNGVLSNPLGLAVDISGNIYIADGSNDRIRMINASGTISTLAGNGATGASGDGGPATSASLNKPYAVIADSFGNVFFSDRSNHRVRVVLASGMIATVAGNGTAAYGGDGGPATAASLNAPGGLAIKDGTLYIADAQNNRVRAMSLRPGDISGPGTVCEGATITLSNTTSNGTWSSGSPANATVGATDGIVTGVAAGTAMITYTSYGYSTVYPVTVTGVPVPDAITGASSVCTGAAVTLSSTTPGGTWSSSGSAISVSGSVVTGVSAGSATVSYTVTNSCGPGSATFSITVDPEPNAGTLYVPATVCIGATTTLSSSVSGGAWSTGGLLVSISGDIVTGVSAGTAPLTYTVTNSCGTASGNAAIEVVDCSTGVNVLSQNALTLHPVPAGNELVISGNEAPGYVTIRDMFGRTLLSGQYNTTQTHIDISMLAPGTYFLTAGQRKAITFVKK